MYTEIRFTLNGEQKLYQGDPLRRLLDVLREDYGLTGSKEGCGEGECGACSIIKNGELVTSCIIPVGAVNGCELLTIEGIRDTEKGKCIIDAYAEGGAVQCGFCIPGMVMATYVLLSKNPDPTEEETAAALEEAKTLADSLYAQYQEGSLLAKLAESDDKASYSSNDKASYSDSVLMNWLFDSARQPGDSDVLFNEDASTYYLVRFNERYRDEVKTVDVRHILIQVDEDGLDSEADDYDTQLQTRKDEAKAKADEILAQWKSGDATEDSFAALANEYSEDPGSNTTGGLYTQVTKGSMVTAFDEWIFDDSRKSGDADIVYAERTSSGSDYKGYHIIYFVGDDLPAWQVTVTNALKNADYNDWYSQQTGDEEITLVDKGVAKIG